MPRHLLRDANGEIEARGSIPSGGMDVFESPFGCYKVASPRASKEDILQEVITKGEPTQCIVYRLKNGILFSGHIGLSQHASTGMQ